MHRRQILRAIPLLVAAPAIVRASSLMAVRPVPRQLNLILNEDMRLLERPGNDLQWCWRYWRATAEL